MTFSALLPAFVGQSLPPTSPVRALKKSKQTQQFGSPTQTILQEDGKSAFPERIAHQITTMVSVTLIFGITLVLLYVVRSIQTFLALRHFGGHWSAGWSRLWLLRTQGSGEMHKRFTAINDKHGKYDTTRT